MSKCYYITSIKMDLFYSFSIFLLYVRISILDYSREREELRLRCQEKRLQRQVDVIRAALNELGCEELPLGYDLSMESSFADSPSISKVIRTISIKSSSRYFYKYYGYCFQECCKLFYCKIVFQYKTVCFWRINRFS